MLLRMFHHSFIADIFMEHLPSAKPFMEETEDKEIPLLS